MRLKVLLLLALLITLVFGAANPKQQKDDQI